jgi:hypothetical protein
MKKMDYRNQRVGDVHWWGNLSACVMRGPLPRTYVLDRKYESDIIDSKICKNSASEGPLCQAELMWSECKTQCPSPSRSDSM